MTNQEEYNTYTSHSGIIMPSGSTANWWEAIAHVWASFQEKYMIQVTSFHQEKLSSILHWISEST